MKSEGVSEKPVAISKGIYQLKLPIPFSELIYLLSYLIEGKDGYLLVDSGWNTKESLYALEKQLSKIKVNLSDISLILVTHIHPDHYGLANTIRKKSKSKIMMHQKTENFLNQFQSLKDYFKKMIEWLKINGTPVDDLEYWLKDSMSIMQFFEPPIPDIFLEDRETLDLGDFRLDVIWTPGHSIDHICLYEPHKKIFISGDHLLPTITPNVSLQMKEFGNPLKDYLESLQKISTLSVEKVLPAHEYIFKNFKRRIIEIEKHHKERLVEVLNALETPKTAFQVAQHVTWTTGPWHKLQNWERRAATFEALAHLVHLKQEGRVYEIKQNENIFFLQKF
ncbi:MAG: MBL fold metallo-hydrolase [Candidatus Jordarchaeum sp.]|uniref:MBL fold metallo-hydrolase n=1 Tax=Candidatus Jordarchaeum sp. TaxID=2823881 RepID=UPI0040497044